MMSPLLGNVAFALGATPCEGRFIGRNLYRLSHRPSFFQKPPLPPTSVFSLGAELLLKESNVSLTNAVAHRATANSGNGSIATCCGGEFYAACPKLWIPASISRYRVFSAERS